MSAQDGGPAYPVMWEYAENETGMTLRDYFAGQALAAWPVTDRGGTMENLAVHCYALADAMLAARGGK